MRAISLSETVASQISNTTNKLWHQVGGTQAMAPHASQIDHTTPIVDRPKAEIGVEHNIEGSFPFLVDANTGDIIPWLQRYHRVHWEHIFVVFFKARLN